MQNRELTDKSKLSKKELAFLIIAATVTITLASTSSPLYPFNPWDDTNCFFTLGRGITHGLIPYKDLYEQKGPLLYFLYAFAAFISDKSFIGGWIIECIAASLFAVFSWKTVKLFVTPAKFSITVTPLLMSLAYTTRLFNFGGNAEELCFPLLTIVLYIGLKSIVTGDGIPSNTEAVCCGLITAALFWIKYTFIGFMAGFCLYILVLSIKHKKFAKLWSLIWRYILGFVMLTVPILLYFVATNSLKYLWEAYFYNNIFLYHGGKAVSGPASIPVVKNIYIPLYCTYTNCIKYPKFGVTLLLSILSVIFINKEHRKKAIFLFVITFCLTIGVVFTRNTFIYYYVYILAYCFSLLLIPFVKGLNRLTKTFKENPKFMQSVIAGFILVCYTVLMLLNKNNYLMLQKKDFLVQYRYAEIINRTPNAKILTYDVMDAGFYTSTGLLPQNRFYCFLNIETNYPPILEEQHRLIDEGYYDYIITTCFCEEEWDNYVMICEDTHPFIDFTGENALDGFRLFKRI